jgi:hypothetical protein
MPSDTEGGTSVHPLDFSDDLLAGLLAAISDDANWRAQCMAT